MKTKTAILVYGNKLSVVFLQLITPTTTVRPCTHSHDQLTSLTHTHKHNTPPANAADKVSGGQEKVRLWSNNGRKLQGDDLLELWKIPTKSNHYM